VYPANESVTWVDDFYSKVWQQRERLILVIQVKSRNSQGLMVTIGYSIHDLLTEDGKLNFGRFELRLMEPPVNLAGAASPSQSFGSTICFTVGQPEDAVQNNAVMFI
jgi:hypothetical protein